MDVAAYPTGYGCAPRDRCGLPAGGRSRAPVTGPVGTATAPVPAPEAEPAPGRSPSASACEPYREVIEIWLGQGRNAKAIWQDLVDDHGFRGAYQSVKRFAGKLRGAPAAGGPCGNRDTTRRRNAGGLRQRPDGPRPGQRPLSAHAAVRADAGLQPQVGTPAHLPLQYAYLGRTARAGISPARRGYSRGGARQPGRRRARPGHLRSHAESALPRHAHTLRRGRARVPRRRSGSKRESGSRRRPRQEDTLEGTAFRKPGRGPDIPGPVGRALGRHPHSRHHQAASGGDVCRGTPGAAAVAPGALPLLPVRRTHRASGRLCRSRGRLLRRAAGLDRPPRPGPVG